MGHAIWARRKSAVKHLLASAIDASANFGHFHPSPPRNDVVCQASGRPDAQCQNTVTHGVQNGGRLYI